jgi:hypothetical protein
MVGRIALSTMTVTSTENSVRSIIPALRRREGGDGAEGEHDAGIKPMMRNDLRPKEPPDKA